MIKILIKVVAIAVLLVSTSILAIIELMKSGTISGITLIPMLAFLIWFCFNTISSDVKDILAIMKAADDE